MAMRLSKLRFLLAVASVSVASAGGAGAYPGTAEGNEPRSEAGGRHSPVRQMAVQAPVPAAEAALRRSYQGARERLRTSPFGRPLILDSREDAGRLKGEVLALVVHPLADVARAFSRPRQWCDVLLLTPNVAQCEVHGGGARAQLEVGVVRSVEAPPGEASSARFSFRAERPSERYFAVHLRAPEGPLGTHDYRIALEAVAVEPGRTFLRVHYSYAYGLAARLAMRAYFMSSGSDKVGFTRIDGDAGGPPRYVDGLRGAVERNAMRCFLAIEAFLEAGAGPPEMRFERSLRLWLDAVERYPRQLHEESPAAYLAAKRHQHGAQMASR